MYYDDRNIFNGWGESSLTFDAKTGAVYHNEEIEPYKITYWDDRVIHWEQYFSRTGSTWSGQFSLITGSGREFVTGGFWDGNINYMEQCKRVR